MTIKMLNPSKVEFKNGSYVYVGAVYGDDNTVEGHPYADGKRIRSGFIQGEIEREGINYFLDKDGIEYEVIHKEPEQVESEFDKIDWNRFR